jgi:hypothetical protein
MEEDSVTGIELWPAVAGGQSALVVFFVGSELLEHRRIRTRRDHLRSRLMR